jgi:hypothetical protein
MAQVTAELLASNPTLSRPVICIAHSVFFRPNVTAALSLHGLESDRGTVFFFFKASYSDVN